MIIWTEGNDLEPDDLSTEPLIEISKKGLARK
jgi:hypothetical protein